MKLRKILASAVAATACVAMLSTNVLASTSTGVSIGTAAGTGTDKDKLVVTIGEGNSTQRTFLAVNTGRLNAGDFGGADIQYIDQDENLDSLKFAQRAGGANKVDIYVGGDEVTDYNSVSGVYVYPELTVTGDIVAYTYSGTFDAEATLDSASVSYAAIGSTAASSVTKATKPSNLTVTAEDASGEGYNKTVTVTDGIVTKTYNVNATSDGGTGTPDPGPGGDTSTPVTTGVVGNVKAYDTTGEKRWNDYPAYDGDEIPVGAVVTAIPVAASGTYSGNVSGVYAKTAKSAMVDANGEFELALEPGKYNIIVSHTRFVYRGNAFEEARMTVLSSAAKVEKVEITANNLYEMKDVKLYYTRLADINLDGVKNADDSPSFAPEFNKPINMN